MMLLHTDIKIVIAKLLAHDVAEEHQLLQQCSLDVEDWALVVKQDERDTRHLCPMTGRASS